MLRIYKQQMQQQKTHKRWRTCAIALAVLIATVATNLVALVSIRGGAGAGVWHTLSDGNSNLGPTTDAPIAVLPPFEPTCFAPVAQMHRWGCPVIDCKRDPSCNRNPSDPSCCSYLHMQMLTFLDRFMTSKCLQDEWVVVYGTALGALRDNGTILAHTEDLDIALTPLAIQVLEQNHTRTQLWAHGYAFFLHAERHVWKLCPHVHHPSPHFQAAMVRNESLKAWEDRKQQFVAGYVDFWLMWSVPEQTTTCSAPTMQLDLAGTVATPWDGQPPGSVHNACPYLQQQPQAGFRQGPVRRTFCVSELDAPLVLRQGLKVAIGGKGFPVAENAHKLLSTTYGPRWMTPVNHYHGESAVSPVEAGVRTALLQKLSVTAWGDMPYEERVSRCRGRPAEEPFQLEA